MQMILLPVHQLIHTVQKENIAGSDLLQLLHTKVTPSTTPAGPISADVCCQTVPDRVSMHTAFPRMSV